MENKGILEYQEVALYKILISNNLLFIYIYIYKQPPNEVPRRMQARTKICSQPAIVDNKCDLCLSIASLLTPIKACSACTRKLIGNYK